MLKLVLSLHDVAPAHLERLIAAEEILQQSGVTRISYLLIPDYHGTGRADLDAQFVRWCRRPRPFEVDWLLHGYRHQRDPGRNDARLTRYQRLAGRFMTAGEDEFLGLDGQAQDALIEQGCGVFERCLDRSPRGFVAPAWLFDDELIGVLRARGFEYTEDHRRMFLIATGSNLRSPVITWATRTPLRLHGSIAAAPMLARLWSREPMLRMALHPFDFDHRNTVASIRHMLARMLRRRHPVLWSEALRMSSSPEPLASTNDRDPSDGHRASGNRRA